MRILGHGIDLVSIPRIRDILERQGEHFRARVFTPVERAYCERMQDPAPHFAARFAAKEAFAKALGLGLAGAGAIGGVGVRTSRMADLFLSFRRPRKSAWTPWAGVNFS